jgi:hypothetical protein
VDGGRDGTGLTGEEERSAEGRDLERLGRGMLVCGIGGGGGDGARSSATMDTADMRLAIVRLSLSKPDEKNGGKKWRYESEKKRDIRFLRAGTMVSSHEGSTVAASMAISNVENDGENGEKSVCCSVAATTLLTISHRPCVS